MPTTTSSMHLMTECMRWFGPEDPVPLSFIRQSGAAGIFTSLHQIPYGEIWPLDAILQHQRAIDAAGLVWTVVESLPVHEEIKTGRGDLSRLFDNYTTSLRNLATAGIRTVVYNFMPVLDWVRTDMRWPLPDGSCSMHFDPVRLAAFEIHALNRDGAKDDYSTEQIRQAGHWWKQLAEEDKEVFVRSIIDVFPGVKWSLSLNDIREMLAPYEGIDEAVLRANLARFLEAILPTAEELGIRLAIHPDDPPFPVLGLPRIVSTATHIAEIFDIADSPSNGLCFCTGSFGSRIDNDLCAMVSRFGSRIHAAHLRSTRLLPDDCFLEAGHLAGSFDMAAVVHALLDELDTRRSSGAEEWQIPLRPDHGHIMMDDLGKPEGITPGYPAIGRMRGLAELRGVMHGLRHRIEKAPNKCTATPSLPPEVFPRVHRHP